MTTTLAIGLIGLFGVIRFAGTVEATITWAGAICAAILCAGVFCV